MLRLWKDHGLHSFTQKRVYSEHNLDIDFVCQHNVTGKTISSSSNNSNNINSNSYNTNNNLIYDIIT